MSKSKVNEYFSTRKRGRFNQNDVLLNKQLKTQSVIDPTDEIGIAKSKLVKAVETELKGRQTRSSSRLKKDVEEEPAQQQAETTEEAPAPTTRAGRALARKQRLEELKAKMSRLDDKLEKVKEVAPKPAAVEPAAPAPVEKPAPTKQKGGRKKVNKAELMAKIQNFNDNLIATQEKIKKVEEVAPVLEETPAASAFNKFKDLASADIDIKCTLTLPVAYARILDSFKGSDSIVKFLTNRQEICTFLKLKLGIQNITKHTFTQKHLGQIKTVYPNAYHFRQEKMFIDFKNDYHLTIRPNLDDIEEIDSVKGIKDFSPSVLLKRLNVFKSNLFTIVKNCHQKFLESIGITNVDFKDIKRWHPKFDLETVEEIADAELPKCPNESIKCKTGQDLLNIAKTVYSSRIQEAIKEHSKESIDTKVDNLEVVGPKLNSAPVEVPAIKENLKPLTADEKKLEDLKNKKEKSYNSLLEKIRNKQKNKEFESMVVNSDKEKKTVKFGLYKDSIRFLLFFFQGEKKATIEMEKIQSKLADNLKEKLSETESRELLMDLINEQDLVSGEKETKWISVIKVRNVNYIKMDKAFQMNDLWAKVDKMLAAL